MTQTNTNNGSISTLFNHLYKVKNLDSVLLEKVSKRVINKLATYLGDKLQSSIKDDSIVLKDSLTNRVVLVKPKAEFTVKISTVTTVEELMSDKNTVFLSYDEYALEDNAIDKIVEKVRMAFLSHIEITTLDESVNFDTVVSSSKRTFLTSMKVNNITIASIKGDIKYGVAQGQYGMNQTLYPTLRFVIRELNGPRNKNILNFLAASLKSSVEPKKAFGLLNNGTDNKEIIALFTNMGIPVDVKSIKELHKMFNNKVVIDYRLDFKISEDKVCVDGRFGNTSTLITPYEATINKSLTGLMFSASEEEALNKVKKYETGGSAIVAKGFKYMGEVSEVELKAALNAIRTQTGSITDGSVGNLFGFSTTNLSLGQTVNNTPSGDMNAQMMQMMQMMQNMKN